MLSFRGFRRRIDGLEGGVSVTSSSRRPLTAERSLSVI
jgi:hypothetical protein